MVNRRSLLRGAALSLAVPAAGLFGSHVASMHDSDWESVPTPTSNALRAVADTATGPFAAGGNGVVVERTDGGWEAALRNGPSGNGNNLSSLAATADGDRLWMAGASGAVGSYDVHSGDVTDRTAPDGVTGNFTALAVTGTAGNASVFLGDTDGTVHVSFDDGRPGSWTHLRPGSGAAVRGLDCYGPKSGVLVDADRAVFETSNGTDWERIGVDDAEGRLTALAATGSSDVWLAGDRLYSRSGEHWAEHDPTAATLRGVAVCHCGCVHAVGDAGTIVHDPGRRMGDAADEDGDGWRESAPTGQTLHAIALGQPHVAVGASGTVLER